MQNRCFYWNMFHIRKGKTCWIYICTIALVSPLLPRKYLISLIDVKWKASFCTVWESVEVVECSLLIYVSIGFLTEPTGDNLPPMPSVENFDLDSTNVGSRQTVLAKQLVKFARRESDAPTTQYVFVMCLICQIRSPLPPLAPFPHERRLRAPASTVDRSQILLKARWCLGSPTAQHRIQYAQRLRGQ